MVLVWSRQAALADVHVIAAGGAGVELARTADLLLRIFDHLAPLADPADGAGDCDQPGEHRGREAQRLTRDARIEVDGRAQLAVGEGGEGTGPGGGVVLGVGGWR